MSEVTTNIENTINARALAKGKAMVVALSQIVADDKGVNIRASHWVGVPEFDNLYQGICAHGQIKPGFGVELDNGKIGLLAGFGRYKAVSLAKQNGKIDPQTNKVFDTFKVIVFKDLSPADRIALLIDQTEMRLVKPDMQIAFNRCFDARLSEKETLLALQGVMDYVEPYKGKKKLTPPTPSNGTEADNARFAADQEKFLTTLRNARAGVMQNARDVYDSPFILQDEWMAGLQGKPVSVEMSVTEMKKLASIHRTEAKSNPSITRAKPGPKFLEAWNAQKKATEEAASLGDAPTRRKATGMLSREQVESIDKSAESYYLRVLTWIIRRVNGLNENHVALVDSALVALEVGDVAKANAVKAEIDKAIVLPTALETVSPDASAPAGK